MATVDIIKRKQHDWADEKGIPIDKDDYIELLDLRAKKVERDLKEINRNIFKGLGPDSIDEITKGDGNELKDTKAKFKALHSSTALAVNVFQYWKRNNEKLSILMKALGIDSPERYDNIKFEQKPKKPEGIDGNRPNIDVLINEKGNTDTPVIAIESKFTETYNKKEKSIKPAYN